MTTSWSLLVLGMVSASAAGCGVSIDTSPQDDAAKNQVLLPDQTGWVDRTTTGTTGIQGQWHVFDEGRFAVAGVPPGGCGSSAIGDCSFVREPARGSPYAPTPGLGMCTSGSIARWIAGSDGITPDGSPGWAGIVLDLNAPDWPEPRTSLIGPAGQPYDAAPHDVTGFAFDIDTEPAPGANLLVQVATAADGSRPGGKPAYWGGPHLDGSPVHAGHNEFGFSEVGPNFPATGMLRLRFLVPGNDVHAVPYDFCIDHLTALRPSIGDPSTNPHSASDDQLLVPDENGWVDRSKTGTTEIQGVWFAAADGVSVISEPDPARETFAPTKDLGMCTSGLVAQATGTSPEAIWGALIGFKLNVADRERRADPYNAELHGVTGFAFDIDSEPAPGAEIQVELETFETQGQGAWWGGGNAATSSPVHAGHNEFHWDAVGGPYWVSDPPPFEWTELTQISFHVPSNPTHAVSYSFCIKNLTALRH